MTETQRRIKAYQKALPHLKERVTAVALLLAMSLAMMTSASFAWVTLSRSPEVSGLATTVSTNGNLEIALSKTDGSAPDESTVTDGAGSVVQSNLTWGNLINLSDPSYGLSDIILRPASLNTGTLLTAPISAIKYSADGRIEGHITDFLYSSYDLDNRVFRVSDTAVYGVRGVSSVTYKNITGDKFLIDQLNLIKSNRSQANNDFTLIYNNKDYMTVIGKLVEVYAKVILQGLNPDCTLTVDMATLELMMKDFMGVIETMGSVYVEIANLRYYQELSKTNDVSGYDPYEVADLINGDIPNAYIKDASGKYLDDKLSEYLKVYNNAETANKGIQEAALKAQQNQPVYWKEIESEVNLLCNMKTATINGYTVNGLLSQISKWLGDRDIGSLWGMMGWDRVPAVINGGVLKEVDQFLGGQFYVEAGTFEVAATYPDAPIVGDVTLKLHPSVTTSAYNNPPFYMDAVLVSAEKTASGGTSLKGDPVAAETYAMAIDFWVRTNQDNALLILEGEVIYAQATGTNEEGEEVGLLYSYKIEDNETGKESTVYLYQDENKDWYYDYFYMQKNDKIEAADVPTNIEKVYSNIPIGYEGVNRVWDELDDPNSDAAGNLPSGAISTTQGSGSCYVFYPQSTEDQKQCLKLLAAMRVAFIDEKGSLLAGAYMDPSKAVEQSGRVIVPLVLSRNKEIPVDTEGNTESFYITKLAKNEAMRVTAMVYLEGTNLSNKDVLAAGSITGQLNLQFGTNTMDMDAVDNEVKNEYYTISFINNVNNKYEFKEEDKDLTVKLQMQLEGLNPNKVTGSFLSVINATQGAKQPTFEFKLNTETGYYEANVTFDGPGSYQLRSIQVDGVDYALDSENIIYVTVPGERVTALTWDGVEGNDRTVMTADSYKQLDLSLTLKKLTPEGTVSSVRGVFLGDNGSNVTVNFSSEDGQEYKGTGMFNSSGTYTLTYVYINDKLSALDENLYKSLTLSLGLRVDVQLTPPYFDEGVSETDQAQIVTELVFENGVHSFVYNGAEPLNFDIRCYIYDDRDKLIRELENVDLYYKEGSVYNVDTGLDAKMSWNEDLNCYTGKFPFQGFGDFTFHQVVINKANYVTRLNEVGHGISAISTDPMSYVPMAVKPLVVDIGAAADTRTLSLMLQNAPAAVMEITIQNADGSVKKTYTTADGGVAKNTNNTTGLTTFTVQVPDDGQWTITSARVHKVFYDGVFYRGGEDTAGWVDLTKVANWQTDNATYFLTEVNVTAENTPDKTTSGQFMTEHTFSGMTIQVMDYDGNDLAATLASLKAAYPEEFAELGLSTDVAVNMTYEWRANEFAYTYTGETLTDLTYGGALTAENGVYAMPEMKVQMAGKYYPDFKLTIGSTTYEAEDPKLSSIADTLKDNAFAEIKWNAPTVTISAISPEGTHTSAKKSGWSATQANVTSQRTDNNRTATVYVEATVTSGLFGSKVVSLKKEPKVTLTLSGTTYAEEAYMTFAKTGGGTVYLYTGTSSQDGTRVDKYTWAKGVNTAERIVGYTDPGNCDNSRVAGELTSSQVVLKHGGREYTFNLGYTIKIINNSP